MEGAFLYETGNCSSMTSVKSSRKYFVHFNFSSLPVRVDPIGKWVEMHWKLNNPSSNLARISKYLLPLAVTNMIKLVAP